VLTLVEPIGDDEAASTELPPYTADDFRGDMRRVTEGRTDPELLEILVGDSRDSLGWLRELGVRLRLMYDRQSYTVNDRHVFWGGLAIGALTEPPFLAFPVTCGITFTFGGVRVDDRARVIDRGGRPMPGLHAAGEVVGGLFFHNYPGGSGLMSGTVLGRRAGHSAAVATRQARDPRRRAGGQPGDDDA
jgi:hypothetical protein